MTSAIVPAALELSLFAFLYLSMVAFTLQSCTHSRILELVHIHETDEILNEQNNIVCAGRMKVNSAYGGTPLVSQHSKFQALVKEDGCVRRGEPM